MSRNDWVVVILALIAYQVYTTVLVIKSDDFDDDVKRSQVITIWLIPIVGCVLVRMRLNAAARERMLREASAQETKDSGQK
jgi:tellurite resistance protein TehA-like permease